MCKCACYPLQKIWVFAHESVCVSVHATPCRKFGSLCLTKSAAAARAIETDCECSGHEFV